MIKLVWCVAVSLSVTACDSPPSAPTPLPAKEIPQTLQPASLPVLVPLPPPAERVTVDSGPRVVQMSGAVLIDGKPATVGSPVTATSTVETGDNSWARITLVPHSIIAVRANTKFTLGTSARKKWSVQLALGAVWSFLPHGSSYEVTTSNAVAGVRGTILYVDAFGPGKSGICACDGDVELSVGKKKKMVKSKHAHIGTIVAGAKMIPQKKMKTPPYHDDIEGAELDKLRTSLDR